MASINGVIESLQNSKISVTDRGLLFGHAVFETLLVLNGKLVDWNEHYIRLQRSCFKAELVCPNETNLKEQCYTLIEHCLHAESGQNIKDSKMSSASLKILVTGGDDVESTLSLNADFHLRPASNIYIFYRPVQSLSVDMRLKGIALQSYGDERGKFFIDIKSTNYLYPMHCLNNAKKNGFDDAILVNENGEYTEGVTSNFFWFDKNYRIFSTPPTGNCLAGTSLLRLQKALQDMQISFEYRTLHKNDTTNCVGCGLISSVRGIMPISRIDAVCFDIDRHKIFFKQLIEIFELCA